MKKYLFFLLRMMRVGCIGFGGGTALIPVMEEEFIKKQKLESKQKYDKDVIVAGLTPGALPVELAAAIGKKAHGSKGMLAAPVAMALPGVLATIALFTVLSVAESGILEWIELASLAASAFIIYLLLGYVGKVLTTCKKESTSRFIKALVVIAAVCVMVCGSNISKLLNLEYVAIFQASTVHVLVVAFFFVFYTGGRYSWKNILVSVVAAVLFLLSHGNEHVIEQTAVIRGIEIVMLLLAVYGLSVSAKEEGWKIPRLKRREMAKETLLWLGFLLILTVPALFTVSDSIMFVGKSVLSSLMSYGGGDAYLAIADGLFVQNGMLPENVYYGQVSVVVNILPGSILCKTLAGVGYYIGYGNTGHVLYGIFLALAGVTAGIAASCGVYGIVYHIYDGVRSFSTIKLFERWFRPIFAGLLINLILSLCNQSRSIAIEPPVDGNILMFGMLGLTAVDLLLGKKIKLKPMWLLLLNLIAVAIFALVLYI